MAIENMTQEQMRAEIERLKAEIAAKRKLEGRAISLRVSEKGAVSIYGFGRFPLTVYPKNLQKLLGMADEINAFIEANKELLSWEKAVEVKA